MGIREKYETFMNRGSRPRKTQPAKETAGKDKYQLARELREKLLAGGGEKAVARQHEKGKLTARERINLLFDEGTFVETGLYVRHHSTNFGMYEKEVPADSVVIGHGLVNGRLVYVSSQDFTVMGGSLGEMHAEKIAHTLEEAVKVGAPIVYINDSGGARIQEGVNSLAGYGRIFYGNVKASGVIPQISAIMGPCAGGASYSPALTDFVFMVENTSQMFITGPDVVKAVTSEEVTSENLGGANVHATKSGCIHFKMSSEKECIEKIKELLTYLPSNYLEKPQALDYKAGKGDTLTALNTFLPSNKRHPYDMKKLVSALADKAQFMEYMESFAPNIITAFAHIGGKSVGIIASQPQVQAGCLDINASIKASRFIRTCDCFNIPLLTLVDVPGYMPGTQQEHGGIIRNGAKLLYAYSEATVPKITVIVHKAYGGAYIGMCSRHLGADVVLAWPDAEIAVTGAEAATNIIFSKEIKKAEDPATRRAELIEEYDRTMMTPYLAAAYGYVDDVIQPMDTRKRVIEALRTLEGKREAIPQKKHGNLPL